MKLRLSIILLLTILLTGCYNNHKVPEFGTESSEDRVTIAEFYDMCSGNRVLPIETEISVSGVVISSDSQSFINKAIYFYDGTCAAKICINMSQTSSLYPEGATITVHLKDLAVKIIDYQLNIGIKDSRNPTAIVPIASEVLVDRFITCDTTMQPVLPKVISCSALSTLLCGEVVTIENMHYAPTSEDETYIAGGYHRFCDNSGNHLYIYIDPYSAAAGRYLPQNEVTITGIVTWVSTLNDEHNQIVILPRYCGDIGL